MIEKGEHSTSVSMMSHFLFDHLLKCTEVRALPDATAPEYRAPSIYGSAPGRPCRQMLFAVISVFRDLHEVTLKIQVRHHTRAYRVHPNVECACITC
jgi:hypothetical protein